MVTEKLLELLNKGVARELQVSVQYLWQHVLARGSEGVAVGDAFKEIAIAEMKHAEQVAERLAYLGGKPTTKPNTIIVGAGLEEMLRLNVAAEEEAIQLYSKAAEVADLEGDTTTRRLFEEILSHEEEHHDTFSKLLVGIARLSQPEL